MKLFENAARKLNKENKVAVSHIKITETNSNYGVEAVPISFRKSKTKQLEALCPSERYNNKSCYVQDSFRAFKKAP
jgi:hypothetical protein